jgi:hypothetical protein
MVTPTTFVGPPCRAARYQREGARSSRCGSFARIGFPERVRLPAITHEFDALVTDAAARRSAASAGISGSRPVSMGSARYAEGRAGAEEGMMRSPQSG